MALFTITVNAVVNQPPNQISRNKLTKRNKIFI